MGTKAWQSSPKLTLLQLQPCLSTTETDVEPLIMHDSKETKQPLDYIRPLLPCLRHVFSLWAYFPNCIELVSTSIQELVESLIH